MTCEQLQAAICCIQEYVKQGRTRNSIVAYIDQLLCQVDCSTTTTTNGGGTTSTTTSTTTADEGTTTTTTSSTTASGCTMPTFAVSTICALTEGVTNGTYSIFLQAINVSGITLPQNYTVEITGGGGGTFGFQLIVLNQVIQVPFGYLNNQVLNIKITEVGNEDCFVWFNGVTNNIDCPDNNTTTTTTTSVPPCENITVVEPAGMVCKLTTSVIILDDIANMSQPGVTRTVTVVSGDAFVINEAVAPYRVWLIVGSTTDYADIEINYSQNGQPCESTVYRIDLLSPNPQYFQRYTFTQGETVNLYDILPPDAVYVPADSPFNVFGPGSYWTLTTVPAATIVEGVWNVLQPPQSATLKFWATGQFTQPPLQCLDIGGFQIEIVTSTTTSVPPPTPFYNLWFSGSAFTSQSALQSHFNGYYGVSPLTVVAYQFASGYHQFAVLGMDTIFPYYGTPSLPGLFENVGNLGNVKIITPTGTGDFTVQTRAFRGAAITSLEVTCGKLYVRNSAFHLSTLNMLLIPNTATFESAGSNAFSSCAPSSGDFDSFLGNKLKALTGGWCFFGTSGGLIGVQDFPLLSSIKEGTFEDCVGLSGITANQANSVGHRAFKNTPMLSAFQATFPNVVSIDKEAFRYSGFQAITLPSASISITAHWQLRCFADMPNLIEVDMRNAVFSGLPNQNTMFANSPGLNTLRIKAAYATHPSVVYAQVNYGTNVILY